MKLTPTGIWRRVQLALALVALGVPLRAAPLGMQGEVRWRGDSHKVRRLPEEMPPAARSAVDAWAPWAKDHDYRLDLDPEGRVLLVSAAGNRRYGHRLKLIARTADWFDKHFPTQALEIAEASSPTVEEEAGGGAAREDDGPLPEDPEDDIVPWVEPGATDTGTEEYTYVWGAEETRPDSQTVVFFVIRNEEDFGSVLDRLGSEYPYLSDWSEEARKFTGFTLQQPLAGAYVEAASGQEEWNPDNELVNRIAQLLLLRRFGQQPNWLVQGCAWNAEFAMLDAVYCFPYRNEFVWATEHAGWEAVLRQRFSDRKKEPLTGREFCAWARGVYEDQPAKIAWGLVRFLLEEPQESRLELLMGFRRFADDNNRIATGEKTWERQRDYIIPVADQVGLLNEHLGDGVLTRATEFFRELE